MSARATTESEGRISGFQQRFTPLPRAMSSMRYVLPPDALPAAAPRDTRRPLAALALSRCFWCRPLLSSRAAIRPTIFPWPPIAAGTGGAGALQRKSRARRRMCCCRSDKSIRPSSCRGDAAEVPDVPDVREFANAIGRESRRRPAAEHRGTLLVSAGCAPGRDG